MPPSDPPPESPSAPAPAPPTSDTPANSDAPPTVPARVRRAAQPRATPVMAQYHRIKADHPDSLLFFRMGDFFEMFFDDAVTAAQALDIALTRRGKHEGADIPMCGVPVHAADAYLARLIRQGHRVAVCEQVESPETARQRGAKAVVRREVVRVVTPGTLTEDTLLDARRHNFLAALATVQDRFGLAWLDISTGDFQVQPVDRAGLAAALARLEPGEILVPDRLLERPDLYDILGDWKSALTPQPAARFNSENARRRLEAAFKVKALDAFGDFDRAELAAAGALLDYVDLTQKGTLPRLAPPHRLAVGAVMEIDAATRRNLELTRTLSGARQGSLLAVIDRTVTGPGARLLATRLAAPLTDPAAIVERLDMVGFLVTEEALRHALREELGQCPDMERALSRLTLGRGGPRDLAAIRDGLARAETLRRRLDDSARVPAGLAACGAALGAHQPLIDRLRRALDPEPALLARDGGFIAKGYSPALDEQRALRDENRRLIAALEARYRAETGIASLKLRHNNVLGYFIEVTSTHADKLLGPGAAREDHPFIHRQTMASGARFTTVELGELETRIANAAGKALALELALFDDLVGEVTARMEAVGAAARALAALDVAAGLATLAVERRYGRPAVDSSLEFAITGGRHPVVEAARAATREGGFVANDCDLGRARRLWLVTGPNMAGKSTFLRQNALIAILAQIGSYVPAEAARIGVVDRLFSRVGAADDLARGRSTFMVEMVETAAILNQAGERALVILDEIGRGTATYDGLSIAWAAVEHLHEVNRCRALFATHYHELAALAASLEALSCHSMRVKEWRDEVVFLHEIAPGTADRAYGLHVARLAGLPPAVVARAQAVLETLEREERSGQLARLADDLPLFGAATPAAPAGPTPLEAALAEINPDELTPKAALELLYKLRGLLAD